MSLESLTPDQAQHRRQVRKAAVASLVGAAIEWYDFFLYGTAAALVFPRLFFPKSDPYIGTLETFATFFMGFAARPVGAAIFGHYGDRLGRKATLVLTLSLMGAATALIGLLPTYSTLGTSAAILLVVLRVLQGVGVGGEWGGSVLLAMEWGDPRRRGLMASWAQVGVPAGLLLSNGVLAATLSLTGEEQFLAWGWRVPFLASVLLIVAGLYIRLSILETPTFRRLVAEKQVARQPVLEVVRSNGREILLSAFLRMSEQAPFYLFTAFFLSYATQHLHLSRQFAVTVTTVAAAVSLVGVPFWGHLSDVVGRKRMYICGILATLAFAFPYFALLETAQPALIILAAVVALQAHDMQYGPQAAFIAESFAGRLRYSGASLGYQLASLVAGGPAPLIAAYLLHQFGSGYAVAAYIVACCLIGLVAAALLEDRTGHDVDTEQNGPVS
jgi:metabolite-proton symporter